MNNLVIIGTITRDRIHTGNKTWELFGGAPWFAVEIAKKLKVSLSIVSKVGRDFPIDQIPEKILKESKINMVDQKTTKLDIFADQDKIPAIIKGFTGKLKGFNSANGKIVIISPLFQEISIKSIKQLRKNFNKIILDLQGFTRPAFKQNMLLSDDIKMQPTNLHTICQFTDILKCSDNEFNVLFEKDTVKEKLRKLHQWGIKNVIVTTGARGCWLSSKNSSITEFKTKPIRVLNTIGAGDKFLILVGIFLLKSNSLEKSIILAQRMLERIMKDSL